MQRGHGATVTPSLAVLGGTGALGSALVARWAAAGYDVVVGSRSRERAVEAARELEGMRVSGETNAHAARSSDIVVIAVPYTSHDDVIDEIAPEVRGKIVVDAVVPLRPPRVSVVHLPEGGSAAVRAQHRLGDEVRVVSAFHNVSAARLAGGGRIDCDVLVCGDDADARERVVRLCDPLGLRGIDAGPIANSVAAEALTAVLIGINRRYRVKHAGLRITGLLPEPAA
jgi:NADPH-dependent F420 reductase